MSVKLSKVLTLTWIKQNWVTKSQLKRATFLICTYPTPPGIPAWNTSERKDNRKERKPLMFVSCALPIQNTNVVLLVPKQTKEENHHASVMSNPSLTLGRHQFGTKNVSFNPTHRFIFLPATKIHHKCKVESRWFAKAWWGFCLVF